MRKSRRANIDAMLRHLASHHEPRDFPGTAYERAALIETAGKRRLIEWRQDRRRFELTRAGERRLRQGVLGSWTVRAAIAATIGAAALALVWLPGARSTGERAAPPSKAQSAAAFAPAPAPAPPATPSAVALDAVAGAPSADPAEPATAEPGATPTDSEAPTTAAKDPAGKKSHKRAARHWNWTSAHHYHDERFAGSGGR